MMKANENGGFSYEISFFVVTYHSEWKSLRATLVSALLQKGITMEIVIADDGSEHFPKEQVEDLFREYGFKDYQLVLNQENHGTIANYISGLKACRGEYTKDIAPGDFLSREGLLRDWVDALRESGYSWSFADVQYYEIENEEMVAQPTPPFPVYLRPYMKHNDKKARWNYAVLDDSAHGAGYMGKTEVLLKYACEIAKTGNLYCEDYMLRIMMFDGICAYYYPETAVYYEYGTGISSGKSDKWKKIIYDEYFSLCQMLMNRKADDSFQQKMKRTIRKKTSKFGMALIPGKIFRWALFQVIRRKPRIDFSATENWRKLCR